MNVIMYLSSKMVIILKEYIGEGQQVPIAELPSKIEKLLEDDFDQVEKEIARFFSTSNGLELLFTKLSQAFFTNVKNDIMSFDMRASTFIGDLKETEIFIGDVFLRLAEDYADSNFANMDLFSWLEQTDTGPDRGDFSRIIGGHQFLNKIQKVLDNGINPIDNAPQHARLYDIIVALFPELVTSFHVKNNRNPEDLKIQDLAADELSTILVDLLIHIRESIDSYGNLKSRITPIRKHKSYSYQTATSVGTYFERKNVAWELYSTKFKMDSFLDIRHQNGDRKINTKSLYKFMVADLINSYIYGDMALTNKDEVKTRIRGLFNDPYESVLFFDELEELAELVFHKKVNQLSPDFYEEIKEIFTDFNNLDELIQETPNGNFELLWNAYIDFLFDSGVKLTWDMIPNGLFAYIERNGQFSRVQLTEEVFNELMNSRATLLVIHDKDTGNLGVIDACLINDLPSSVREGYYYHPSSNKEDIVHNIFLNKEQGNYLISRVGCAKTGFYVHNGGKDWFKNPNLPFFTSVFDNIQGIDIFSLNYYRALGYTTGNRFIAMLQQVEDIIVPTTPYQPIVSGVDKIINPLSFKFEKDQVSYLDEGFENHPNYDFIKENALEFINHLSQLVYITSQVSMSYSYLPIDNYILQILGAFKDENGQIHLGPKDFEIELLFNTLVGPNIDYNNPNSLPYRLCSISFKDSTIIQNVKFRHDQTRKQWFQTWLDVFRSYKAIESNHPLIKKLNDILITREKGFAGLHFDFTFSNEKSSEQELILAARIKDVLIELFGRHMFKAMYEGSVFMKNGILRFMGIPWTTLHDSTVKNTHISLYTPYRGDSIMPGHSPTESTKMQYLFDRITSSFIINLPTLSGIWTSLGQLVVPEVPLKFWLPQYKKPTVIKDPFHFYTYLSTSANSIFLEALSTISSKYNLKGIDLVGKSLFLRKVLESCQDKGITGYKLTKIDEELRRKIVTPTEIDFRKEVYNWLTSKGSFDLTIDYDYGNLVLNNQDFKVYFREEYALMAFGFETLTTFNDPVSKEQHTERSLRSMQDFITELIDFIFELTYTAPEGKLVFYPFNSYSQGYGIRSENTFVPFRLDSSELEWEVSNQFKSIGFVLDINDPSSIHNFIENIPVILGNFFVRPAAFIARTPGMGPSEFYFAFDMTGRILPKDLKRDPRYSGPPKGGMTWYNGDQTDYLNWVITHKFEEILNTHEIIAINRYRKAEDFYTICFSIAFIRDFSRNIEFYI